VDDLKVPSVSDFPTLAHLYLSVRDYLSGGQQKVSHGREALIEDGQIEVVYEAPNLRIYTPLTEKASQVLGVGTQWCIAQTEGCAFNDYNEKGRFLIVFAENETPVALHFATCEFRDNADEMINLHQFLRKHPIISRIGFWHLSDAQKELADFLLKPYVSELDVYLAKWRNPEMVAEILRHEDMMQGQYEMQMDVLDVEMGIDRFSLENEALLLIRVEGVRRNYLSIRKVPDAEVRVQVEALRVAQECLGRIQNLMPEQYLASLENARAAFGSLANPSKEVRQWLADTESKPQEPVNRPQIIEARRNER
jgi:hypothetical protein